MTVQPPFYYPSFLRKLTQKIKKNVDSQQLMFRFHRRSGLPMPS